MSIKQHYHSHIAQLGFHEDSEQTAAIEKFQRLYNDLLTPPKTATLFSGLLDKALKRTTPVPRGLYLWGGAGRGKTYLMDLFYHHLPIQQKQRIHFHHFMQNIHVELADIQHQSDPLTLIARRIAEKTRVLCLDEFYVADIGDAMLLAGLLQALFANHVVLVTTSNTTPDNLYRNGLQRKRFLPAITLIKQHTQLVKMHLGDDYRLKTSNNNALNRYQLCKADDAFALMKRKFQQLSGDDFTEKPRLLKIKGRNIPVVAVNEELIWFDFSALCETARSTGDYLEIAQRYRRVMITHIPLMDEALDNAAIRFIHLIDALYDHKVELFTTAAAAPQELYCGVHHNRSFKRAASRLCEMGRYSHRDD